MYKEWEIYYKVLWDKILNLKYIWFTNREWFLFIDKNNSDSYLFRSNTKYKEIFETKKQAIENAITYNNKQIEYYQNEIEKLVKLF